MEFVTLKKEEELESNGKVKTIETMPEMVSFWHVPPVMINSSLGRVIVSGIGLAGKDGAMPSGEDFSAAQSVVKKWFNPRAIKPYGGIKEKEEFLRSANRSFTSSAGFTGTLITSNMLVIIL